jgi:N-acetylmuramoyl-L-alanine amidase
MNSISHSACDKRYGYYVNSALGQRPAIGSIVSVNSLTQRCFSFSAFLGISITIACLCDMSTDKIIVHKSRMSIAIPASSRLVRSMRTIFLVPFLFAWLSAGMAWAAPSAIKTDVETAKGAEQVIIYFDQMVTPVTHFQLDNPRRLVVDIKSVKSGAGIGLSPNYSGQLLGGIRFGRPKPDISRIVLDLNAPIEAPVISIGRDPPRLGIALKYNSTAVTKTATSAGSKSGAPIPSTKPKQMAKEVSKPLIVIDPGHGGKDSGALGTTGILEKNLTLRYAKALRDALKGSGRYRVMLTREDDSYLFLKERVDVARQHKADMFISLHADSNPNPSARGFSVYTLSEEASDAETAALAEQENRADVIGGIDLAVEDKQVANILLDLAQRETRNKGSEFAELMISNMHPKVPMLTNTHRFAGFRVLKAPDMPSVLLEIGFLSNEEDEARLQSREYQSKVTRSMLDAIDAYWQGRKRINSGWLSGSRITFLKNEETVIEEEKAGDFKWDPHLRQYLVQAHYGFYDRDVTIIRAYRIKDSEIERLARQTIDIEDPGISYMLSAAMTEQYMLKMNKGWDESVMHAVEDKLVSLKNRFKGKSLNDLFSTHYDNWPDGIPGTVGEKFHIYLHSNEINWAYMDNFLLRGGEDLSFQSLGEFEFEDIPKEEMIVQIFAREDVRVSSGIQTVPDSFYADEPIVEEIYDTEAIEETDEVDENHKIEEKETQQTVDESADKKEEKRGLWQRFRDWISR